MKFVSFPEANHHYKNFHYYQTREGIIVMALEMDKKDIEALKRGDKLFVIAGPGLALPPPMQLSLISPFTETKDEAFVTEENPVIIPRMEINQTPANEKADPKSTSDNEQPHKGDN